MRRTIKFFSVITLPLGIALLSFFSDLVYSQAPYYQGKTITILRGGEPGMHRFEMRRPDGPGAPGERHEIVIRGPVMIVPAPAGGAATQPTR